MRTKLQLICILTAWLFATGAQWDVTQTFAWAKMFSSYSKSMSLGSALKKTFGGEMCAICRAVDCAKQQERAASLPSGGFTAKMVFVLQEKPIFIFATPLFHNWSPSDTVYDDVLKAGPPTPPPRVLV